MKGKGDENDREARLAEALRANLRRRKAQTRRREVDVEPDRRALDDEASAPPSGRR
ncbi:MAG TPA: hypothetical protein VJ994_06480 [Paracoccaceae bacterium]|nr:hypothetical protein [Paracoccaceae bacterium]